MGEVNSEAFLDAAMDRIPNLELDERGRIVGCGLTLAPTDHQIIFFRTSALYLVRLRHGALPGTAQPERRHPFTLPRHWGTDPVLDRGEGARGRGAGGCRHLTHRAEAGSRVLRGGGQLLPTRTLLCLAGGRRPMAGG